MLGAEEAGMVKLPEKCPLESTVEASLKMISVPAKVAVIDEPSAKPVPETVTVWLVGPNMGDKEIEDLNDLPNA